MYLFFDAVSQRGYLGLYTQKKSLVSEYFFSVQGNEGKALPSMIDDFLKREKVDYQQIQNIVCVVGPGSFTGIRMLTLVVNTIAYIYPHISLTPLSFFDLYEEYPIIKTSSKKDLFVKWEKSATIEVLSNDEFLKKIPKQTKWCFGNADVFFEERSFSLEEKYIPSEIFSKVEFQKLKKLAPLYIKKPNIS